MLSDLFGDTTSIRVLDYMLDNRDVSFTLDDMLETTGVDESLLPLAIEPLIEFGFVEMDGERYMLNASHPAIEALINFDRKLSDFLERQT